MDQRYWRIKSMEYRGVSPSLCALCEVPLNISNPQKSQGPSSPPPTDGELIIYPTVGTTLMYGKPTPESNGHCKMSNYTAC